MTTLYIPQYLIQVSRIRNLLRFYRDSFLSLSYIDGTGYQTDSAYDIWINLCLITSKTRPAFLVQWIDYMDPTVYEKIMSLLVHYRDNLEPDDIDYRLLFLIDPSGQGVIVTTYYSYYKDGIRDLYSKYLQSDSDDILLGLILGFPAAGEITLQPGEMEYIDRDIQPPGRHAFTIYAKPDGFNPIDIMANIYRTAEARNRLNEFALKIIETVKIYDPETVILISDTQPITDTRITLKNILLEQEADEEDTQIKSEDDITQYDADSNDQDDYKSKNWNTEFDRIFELGYIYNRK